MSNPHSWTPRLATGLSVFLASAAIGFAQVGAGGSPPGLLSALTVASPVEELPRLNAAQLLAEDAANADKVLPFRFGIGLDTSVGLENGGVWEDLPTGERVWHVRFEAPGAHSLNLIFDRYALPPGARLFVYNDTGRVLGAFTSEMNRPHGMFATEPLAGDAVNIEYVEPADAELGDLRLSQVIYAYKDIVGVEYKNGAPGFSKGGGSTKASGSCNINVNCPLGANWQDEKHAVARLIMGGVLCTGALINNTAHDSKQYFLTANHCYSGNPATWVFNFNFESTTCAGTSGSSQTVSGAALRTKSATGDNCLVEITQAIPSGFNPYFMGWSRSTTPSTTSTGIHHPQGDIKKICQDTNSAISSSFGGTACWQVASWEFGVTEGGSSGSPLFDQNHRLIGQLYGGQATCSFLFNDYYGKFLTSWSTGLSTYLDPTGSNAMTLDGEFAGAGLPSTYCTAKLTSQGFPPDISYFGSPSLASNNFQLACSNGLPNLNTIWFYGVGQNNQPFYGGTLCVLPPVIRGPLQQFDAFGLVASPINITAGMVGTSRYYQYWGRDPANPDGTGVMLSNALKVTFVN